MFATEYPRPRPDFAPTSPRLRLEGHLDDIARGEQLQPAEAVRVAPRAAVAPAERRHGTHAEPLAAKLSGAESAVPLLVVLGGKTQTAKRAPWPKRSVVRPNLVLPKPSKGGNSVW